ncbi:MAG: tripartite tricarboxylate transporter TctB family protein [Proteobacteria bacterium]|nr:tripartite tricarboxylate transporter TctB family protein [Pseudomonadota bacterium]
MKLTTRNAEIFVAVILALCSIGLMIKAAQNSITWTIEDNMGAGFMPFWLSLGMLICTIITIFKWVIRKSPQSNNNEPFIDPEANKYVYVTILSLIGLILGTAYVGIYISLIFFLFFYLKNFSEKSNLFISVFSIATPIVTFCFFEWLLKITLPQGISEPLFYPIYELMY